MEDSKKLIDELLAKLAELNSKVDNFRQDMLSEFNKFTEELLRGVPDNVSYEVTRVISRSMAKYPLLSMSSGYDCESVEPESPVSPVTHGSKPKSKSLREGRKSPPPVLYHTSGIPKTQRDGARGPHDREFEFQGVFTPTYLPLLDGNEPPTKQQRVDPSLAFRRTTSLVPGGGPSPGGEPPYDSSPASAQAAAANDDDDDDAAVVEMIEEAETPETSKGKDVARPSPARELTDVSVSSSVGSSTSEHKTRRSALRRSSSSAKGSPRRVRFDMQGIEVLPTASPQPTQSVLGHMVGSDVDAGASSAIDDSEDYSGPSLSDVEGEEDHRPRPPRISSTEALRRLSRTPSDDGTIWIPSNETPLPSTNGRGSSERASAATTSPARPATSPPHLEASPMSGPSAGLATTQHTAPPNGRHATEAAGSPAEAQGQQDDDEDDSSEEEFLAIKSPKKGPSPPSPTSPPAVSPSAKTRLGRSLSSQVKEDASTPTPKTMARGKGKEAPRSRHDDEDELFNFDDPTSGPATAEKYLPDEEDEEPVVDEDLDGTPTAPANLFSSSPAISIAKRKSPSPPAAHSKPVPESIGSYKGQPLRMGVVVSPEIAAQAAAMGDIRTYVGSVHGRTGIDPADESSYRASFSNAKLLSGTPRSFSERLMMEEAMGERNDDDDVE